MPTKGTKRGASAAPKEEPGAKRVADFLKQHGVSKAMHEGIREIINHPLAGLSADCQKMLLAMLPWSLCVPSDERHEVQQGTVKWIEEILESVLTKMRDGVAAESASVTDADSRKEELDKGVTKAEESLAEAVSSADKCKAELAEASAALLKKKQALSDAEGKMAKENKEYEQLQSGKRELEAIRDNSFKKLKDANFEEGDAEKLFKDVKAIMPKLDLDASMQSALPPALKKVVRGQFEKTCVDTFGETLDKKIASLEEAMDAIKGPASANIAAVEAAQKELDGSTTVQQEIANKYGAAQEVTASATAQVKAAKGEVKAFRPEYTKATAARQLKQEELEGFEAYNLSMFRTLRDRLSKKEEAARKEAEEASKTADAEAPAQSGES